MKGPYNIHVYDQFHIKTIKGCSKSDWSDSPRVAHWSYSPRLTLVCKTFLWYLQIPTYNLTHFSESQ